MKTTSKTGVSYREMSIKDDGGKEIDHGGPLDEHFVCECMTLFFKHPLAVVINLTRYFTTITYLAMAWYLVHPASMPFDFLFLSIFVLIYSLVALPSHLHVHLGHPQMCDRVLTGGTARVLLIVAHTIPVLVALRCMFVRSGGCCYRISASTFMSVAFLIVYNLLAAPKHLYWHAHHTDHKIHPPPHEVKDIQVIMMTIMACVLMAEAASLQKYTCRD